MDTLTVTVSHPVPTASLTAQPAVIPDGGSAKLTWTYTNTEKATIEPEVDPDGFITVSPLRTITYTIRVTGPGGTAEAVATVTVNDPLPEVNISVLPEGIKVGHPPQAHVLDMNAFFSRQLGKQVRL